MALTYDKILIANDIRGKQGEAGFAPRINATTGTWERWDGTAWTDTGIKAQGDPADITGQSLYEYAVTNGFAGSYDDWLKEYLGQHTDLPWCRGRMQDRSITHHVNEVFTPVFEEGTAGMINGNTFIPLGKGLYYLRVYGAQISMQLNGHVIILRNGEEIAKNLDGVAWGAPSIDALVSLGVGDYLSYTMMTSTISGISSFGASHQFFFAKIMKIMKII